MKQYKVSELRIDTINNSLKINDASLPYGREGISIRGLAEDATIDLRNEVLTVG